MKACRRLLLSLALTVAAGATAGRSEEGPLPTFLKDRGTGVATSMFGTYIRRGELIVYPYWEYYVDNSRQTARRVQLAGTQDFTAYREANGSSSPLTGSPRTSLSGGNRGPHSRRPRTISLRSRQSTSPRG